MGKLETQMKPAPDSAANKQAEKRTWPKRPDYSAEFLAAANETLVKYENNPSYESIKKALGLTARLISIPNPSFHEQEIIDYISNTAVAEAERNNRPIIVEKDKSNNLAIIFPATSPELDNAPVITVQAHNDSIYAGGKGVTIDDPANYSIKPVIDIGKDGEQCGKAESDTTATFDNKVGLGLLLQAALDLDNEKDADGKPVGHGPIIYLATSGEEMGLLGAKYLIENNTFPEGGEFRRLFPRTEVLLNADAFEGSTLFVGCLGAEMFKTELPIKYEETPADYDFLEIRFDGPGGHSGAEAHHPSPFSAVADILNLFEGTDYRIAKFNTKNKHDNAIAKDGSVVLAVPKDQREEFVKLASNRASELEKITSEQTGCKVEFSIQEPEETPEKVLDSESSQKLSELFRGLMRYQKVESYSDVFDGKILDRSMNTSLIKFEEDKVIFNSFARIGKQEMFGVYEPELQQLADKVGATLETNKDNNLPVWVADESKKGEHDEILEIFRSISGDKVSKKIAAGGMEMARFSTHKKDLFLNPDNVLFFAMGPTIDMAHNPGERMNIRSAADTFLAIQKLLRRYRDKAIAKVDSSNSEQTSTLRREVAEEVSNYTRRSVT